MYTPATGFFALNFHKPKAVNLDIIFELTRLVNIGNDLIAIKIVIISFIIHSIIRPIVIKAKGK